MVDVWTVLRSSNPRQALAWPDTSAPGVFYFPRVTPDRWLKELQKEIDIRILEEEMRVRNHMTVLCDPSRHIGCQMTATADVDTAATTYVDAGTLSV